MNGTPDDLRPIALAMYWVQVVTAVVAMMILPGLAGVWADRRWNTGFLALTGFAVGLAVGIYYLLKATSKREIERAKRTIGNAVVFDTPPRTDKSKTEQMQSDAEGDEYQPPSAEADESEAGSDPDSQ